MINSDRQLFESVLDYPDILLLLRLVVGLVFVVAGRNELKDAPAFAKDNGLSVPIAWGLIIAEASGGLGLSLASFPNWLPW